MLVLLGEFKEPGGDHPDHPACRGNPHSFTALELRIVAGTAPYPHRSIRLKHVHGHLWKIIRNLAPLAEAAIPHHHGLTGSFRAEIAQLAEAMIVAVDHAADLPQRRCAQAGVDV